MQIRQELSKDAIKEGKFFETGVYWENYQYGGSDDNNKNSSLDIGIKYQKLYSNRLI